MDESPPAAFHPGGNPLRPVAQPLNRSLRSCLAVSVPVMAVFLLLFNILTVALQVTGAEEEWG